MKAFVYFQLPIAACQLIQDASRELFGLLSVVKLAIGNRKLGIKSEIKNQKSEIHF